MSGFLSRWVELSDPVDRYIVRTCRHGDILRDLADALDSVSTLDGRLGPGVPLAGG